MCTGLSCAFAKKHSQEAQHALRYLDSKQGHFRGSYARSETAFKRAIVDLLHAYRSHDTADAAAAVTAATAAAPADAGECACWWRSCGV
eukprot:1048831-Pelagomonas_calceolata.AAC.5